MREAMKPTIELFLVTSVTCNLGCKSCAGGRKEKAPSGVMSLEMLERILVKATAEARVLLVQLFFLNEPFLIPRLAGMVRLCHKYKLPVLLSTNLNVFDRVPEVMAECPERLLLSVSGWTQPVYERSHKNGNIEVVKANMAKLAAIRSSKTEIQVSWHHYLYNEHEAPQMAEYAKKLGFGFMSYGTSLLPQKAAMRMWETGIVDRSAEDLLVPVMQAKKLCYERRHWDCSGQYRIVVVDSRGVILHCNGDGYQKSNERGSFFDRTIAEFLAARRMDPECARCKAVGCHVYCMQVYTRSLWSPMRWAGQACRWLGIEGYIEPLLRPFYGRKLLPLARK